MGPVEQLAAKGLRRRPILSISAGSGKGTQDPCLRAQAKFRPGVFTVLFFIALFSCCAESIAIWTAAASIAGQAGPAQEVEGHLHRVETKQWLDSRISELQLQPFLGKSTAQQIESAKEGGKEDSRQHRAHVAPCCRGFREDRGSESAQGCRQRDYLPSPGEAAHRVSPRTSQGMLRLFRQSSSCDRSGIPPTSLLVRQTWKYLYKNDTSL